MYWWFCIIYWSFWHIRCWRNWFCHWWWYWFVDIIYHLAHPLPSRPSLPSSIFGCFVTVPSIDDCDCMTTVPLSSTETFEFTIFTVFNHHFCLPSGFVIVTNVREFRRYYFGVTVEGKMHLYRLYALMICTRPSESTIVNDSVSRYQRCSLWCLPSGSCRFFTSSVPVTLIVCEPLLLIFKFWFFTIANCSCY